MKEMQGGHGSPLDELNRRLTLLQGDVVRLLDMVEKAELRHSEVTAAALRVFRRRDPAEANPGGVSFETHNEGWKA